MISAIRKTPDSIRNSTYSVDFWRDTFKGLIEKLEGDSLISSLVAGDSYYDSYQGTKDYKNLTASRASLIKTKRACEALESYLDSKRKAKKSLEKVLKRQKLVQI